MNYIFAKATLPVLALTEERCSLRFCSIFNLFLYFDFNNTNAEIAFPTSTLY